MERISWDQFFMAQSHLLALRSTCTRLSVGATIVRDNRIVAGGYNGSISGGDHCIDKGCYVVDGHCVRTIHAEMNALLQCAKYGAPVAGAEIYVTHFPCLQCTKAIIQAGISKLVYASDYKNNEYALELLQQAGVRVLKVPFEEREVDFLAEEKLGLYEELLGRLKDSGIPEEELGAYGRRVKALFG